MLGKLAQTKPTCIIWVNFDKSWNIISEDGPNDVWRCYKCMEVLYECMMFISKFFGEHPRRLEGGGSGMIKLVKRFP